MRDYTKTECITNVLGDLVLGLLAILEQLSGMTFQSSLVRKPHSFQLLKLSCVRRYLHPLAPTMVDSRRLQRPTQDSLRT